MLQPTQIPNPYIFGDPQVDRYRLEIQTQLLEGFVRQNARRFCGARVASILDLGCGDGKLDFVLKEVYPHARLVGIDLDEAAIAKARDGAAARQLEGCEFIAGDVDTEIPAGQFDLVYASLILLHISNPRHVVAMAVNRLAPGGHIWIKDVNPDMLEDRSVAAFAGGSYMTLLRLLEKALAKIGGDARVATWLPDYLHELGMVDVQTEAETYPLGGSSDVGQAMLGNSVTAFFSARKYIISEAGIDKAEFERLLNQVIEAWKAGEETIRPIGLDIIARKP